MNEIEDLLNGMMGGMGGSGMGSQVLDPNQILGSTQQNLFNMIKFNPTMRMRVIACIVLVLISSTALLRSPSNFARALGMVLFIISLIALILIILGMV